MYLKTGYSIEWFSVLFFSILTGKFKVSKPASDLGSNKLKVRLVSGWFVVTK